jgi:cytochrome c553
MKFFVAATLAVAATGVLLAPDAAAQPLQLQPGVANELRAVYATSQEIAEGARIAQTACARCHGANGISMTKGVPHLAGQRAAYLDLQLRTYRYGARPKSAMTGAVRYLSEEALVNVAAYYASLDPPRPAAPAKGATAPADPMQAGKDAAAGCGGCHGEAGVSATPGMPSLVGLDPKYFVAAMNAYKSGERRNDMMKSMVAALSPETANDVALYYALQKPARAQTPAPGDAAAGKTAATACSGCHGDQGVSASPATPSLAGQDAEYFIAALRAYKDGARKDETMKSLAAALDDKAMRDLAAYYAAQPPQAPNVRRPFSLAEWSERCDRCHGANGNSIEPLVPRLAAQRADWLEQVLADYRSGARKSTAMAAMSALMSERDVKELAAYYARQSARAVVYLVVPPAGAKRDK